MNKIRVTAIGGGTGTFIVLNGLKYYDLDLAAIVSMMDSGGSTGRLRDQLSVLPPGDLRQAMLALSKASDLWRRLFLYRFNSGDLKGHNFGNIFISALEKVSANYQEVIDVASSLLGVCGEVIPVTLEKTHLCVEYASGLKLKGEGVIDENNFETSRIINSYLEPQVKPNQRAISRLQQSDYIIIGPGDLYSSIMPVFLVDGVSQVFKKSKARVIFILNLMTKLGQTTNYKASNFIEDLYKYTGRQPDIILVNNAPIDQDIIDWYADHKDIPVVNDLEEFGYKGKVFVGDLINHKVFVKDEADVLTRSILRHDCESLAKILIDLMK